MTNYLASPSVNPTVYNSLQSSGSSIFGAGVLGANYSSTSTGSYTYTASNTQDYNLTGANSFTLGLLTMGSYNTTGFTSITFTVAEGSTTLLTKTFTSLSSAQTYFTDDPVSLGDITGDVDLKLTYKLTASATLGAGISYLVADAPVTDAVHAPGNITPLAPSPHQTLMIGSGHSPGLASVLWRFDSADVGAGQYAPKSLVRVPEQHRAAELLKALHR